MKKPRISKCSKHLKRRFETQAPRGEIPALFDSTVDILNGTMEYFWVFKAIKRAFLVTRTQSLQPRSMWSFQSVRFWSIRASSRSHLWAALIRIFSTVHFGEWTSMIPFQWGTFRASLYYMTAFLKSVRLWKMPLSSKFKSNSVSPISRPVRHELYLLHALYSRNRKCVIISDG